LNFRISQDRRAAHCNWDENLCSI